VLFIHSYSCYCRWGNNISSVYLHCIAYHLPIQFSKFDLRSYCCEANEALLAVIKRMSNNSNHTQSNVALQVSIRMNTEDIYSRLLNSVGGVKKESSITQDYARLFLSDYNHRIEYKFASMTPRSHVFSRFLDLVKQDLSITLKDGLGDMMKKTKQSGIECWTSSTCSGVSPFTERVKGWCVKIESIIP